MTKPTVRIHDLETDEVIDREMTDEEFLEYTKSAEREAVEQKITADKLAAREAVYTKLGLTADEVAALFG